MLEQEIAKLSENIEYLNSLLEVMANTAKVDTIKSDDPKAKSDAPKAEVKQDVLQDDTHKDEVFTHNDIKSLALDISRKDRDKRDDIKAKLAEFGAKVATDLSEADTQTAGAYLSALKVEVGA